ncbi:MAG: hypothetical protein RMI43_06695 [Candidatus Caldarchaeum sp.]|nr:hypothetical protein [Candidatus Caldarchaeum sp.]MDW8063842.1 hypothetical protein [Candidatus Caldarchaeum sp.]
MNVQELLGKKTIIIGETGTGKTKLLAEILGKLCGLLGPSKITVIDLAPEKIRGTGGPLTLYIDTTPFHYLRPAVVYAPRLMACNAEDVIRYAKHNAEKSKELFEKYLQRPTELLAINDMTIYLHAGETDQLIKVVEKAATFLATAYYGEKLADDFGTGLSRLEKEKLEIILEKVDNVVRLNSSGTPSHT